MMTREQPHDEPEFSLEEDQKRLGQRLREAREYIGLSQDAVAESLRISRPSISAMETGSRKVSSLELKALASLYKRSIEWFIGETPSEDFVEDEKLRALFRTTRNLSDEDKDKVLSFAQWLRTAGRAPSKANTPEE